MEPIETLQRIKDLEELSEKKLKQAEEKAAELAKESDKKGQEKLNAAKKEAKDLLNSRVETVEKNALNDREKEIEMAKKKAEKIKPLENDEMLEIFNEVLEGEFDL
jgi:vacuolar-type H+-ATPase subunit H